ncbi:TatD family hydrolase [Saccharicrinis sp. GN24d3]|uniref:TatD family hydrolase n=1 Tax=Saccharicrinis sp. GN24d3 TaxID=3458416 RepID=UPI00403688B0
MLIDCHTHQRSPKADIAIINQYPYDFKSDSEKHKYSCGIHPWFIQEDKIKSWLNVLVTLCQQKKIVAIGECGLDKNIENIEFQKNVFEPQIRLSEQYKLPVVIHSVKTHHLISEIRKKCHVKQPWIIHGFNGSIEMGQQFVKQNIFISFGQDLIKRPDKFQKILSRLNMDFVLLETDDCDISIVDVYRQAAKLLNLDMGLLENKIEANFNSVFG